MPNAPVPKPPAVYLDSCVLIDVIGKVAPHAEHTQPIIEDAQSDAVVILASVMCVTEVGASKAKTTVTQDKIDDFFRQTYFEFRSVTQGIARSARSIAFNHNVKPIDAIHLATCIDAGVRWFLTRDGDDGGGKKSKMLKLDQTFPMHNGTLRIVTPEHYRQTVYGYTMSFLQEK